MFERMLVSQLALCAVVVWASSADSADVWPAMAQRHRERAQLPLPAGYSRDGREDTFSERSFATDVATRREAFLADRARRTGSQIILAERDLPVSEGSAYGDLLHIDRRPDCAVFSTQSALRLLFQYDKSGAFSEALVDHAKQTVLDFKYWHDEPGIDSTCSWPENHHILFTTAGYLAGQRYPDLEFTNSGWLGPLLQNDKPISLRDYPRYDNPYAQAEFPADRVAFRHRDQRLKLEWPSAH